jgi:preprotein translocase SecE subunit
MGESGLDEASSAGAGAESTAVAPGVERSEATSKRRGKPQAGRGGGPGKVRPAARRRSFFEVYKRGQGTYTRGGTALGAGILVLAGANFVYGQLSIYRNETEAWTLWLQAGIPLLLVVGFGLLTFWIVGAHRRACDFMIATEGEMKKVNWSTRREIIGSTKVVILFTILLAIILFVVDIVFMTFFAWIGVLREAPSIMEMLFGSPT